MDKIEEFNGFKLACNVPPYGFTSSLPKLSASGFRTWTRNEILDALRAKPKKLRRKQFAGKDWIVNQGGVGSCNAAACTGSLRRAMALNGANSVPMLNWEFLYAQINRGSDNGSVLAEGNEAIRNIGVPTLKPDHQFNRAIYKQYYKPADYEEAKNFKAEQVYEVDTEEELASLVLSGTGSAVVAVHVGNNFNNFDSYGCAGATPGGMGNHSVIAQDAELVDGRILFDMPNSWGLEWGDEGHTYLEWNRHLATTNRYHKFFVVLSTDTKITDDNAVPVKE